MPDYRLRIGMKFRQQGRFFLIERSSPDGTIAVKNLLNGETTGRTHCRSSFYRQAYHWDRPRSVTTYSGLNHSPKPTLLHSVPTSERLEV